MCHSAICLRGEVSTSFQWCKAVPSHLSPPKTSLPITWKKQEVAWVSVDKVPILLSYPQLIRVTRSARYWTYFLAICGWRHLTILVWTRLVLDEMWLFWQKCGYLKQKCRFFGRNVWLFLAEMWLFLPIRSSMKKYFLALSTEKSEEVPAQNESFCKLTSFLVTRSQSRSMNSKLMFFKPSSKWGNSKTKDSLKTGFRVLFFTWVFFLAILWSL